MSASSGEDLPALVRALDHRPERDERALFKIERFGSFVRAVDAGLPVSGMVVCERLARSPVVRVLVRRLRRSGVPAVDVAPEQFRPLARGARASGIVAVLPQRWRRLDEVVPTGPWVVVEHLRSTGNLGCILRTCEAAGVEGVFFVGDALDPHDPEVVSTSMGGLLGLSLVRTGWGALGRWCRTHAVALVGSAPGAPLRWDDFRYPERTVVALGDERRGLPAPVLARCDAVVSIPLAGRADSLNVGTAAGVLLFELVRQRLH